MASLNIGNHSAENGYFDSTAKDPLSYRYKITKSKPYEISSVDSWNWQLNFRYEPFVRRIDAEKRKLKV